MKHATRGRPPSSTRPHIEDFPTFDINWLRRRGARHRGQAGQITWRHAPSGRTEVVVYEVGRDGFRVTRADGTRERIEVTILPKGNGGWQPLLVCPDCDRRCRYLLAANRLRCRHCCRALYAAQYGTRLMTASSQRRKLRARLEERDGIPRRSLDMPPWPRPKQMWHRTWARIEARDDALAARWRDGVTKKYGRVC